MLIEFIKFLIYSGIIVIISKYVLVTTLRKLAETLNLKPKTVGDIAGYATSMPELLTIGTSSFSGLISASIVNVISSNVINLIQYVSSIFLNKNQKVLKNRAIKIDLILVAITIIIPIILFAFNIEINIGVVPIFIGLCVLFVYLNSNVHKLYLKNEEEKLEKEKNRYNQMVASGRYTQEQLNAEFYELTKATNLYEYGKDIIYTTERMSLNKNVLNQKYYIVIPYYPDELGENNFDKQEIRNLAFSELYTRAQSIIRTLSVCGINGRVLDSNSLVDLLYVAYNRDDAEIYGVDKAMQAGYDELYSTAPDVIDKKMKTLDEQIEKEAFAKANQKVAEAKSEKQKALEQKQESQEELISQLAALIIEQNKSMIGEDVAANAIEKVQEEAQKRRGRPKKSENLNEGGTKENEQEEKTKRRRATKTA